MPVSKSVGITTRSSTADQTQGHYKKPNNAHNLKRSEPELGFAIYFDGETIQGDDDDDGNRNPYGHTNWWMPVVDHKSCCGDFGWDGDGKDVLVHIS